MARDVMKVRDARGVFRDVGLSAEEIWPVTEEGVVFQMEKGTPPDLYAEDVAYRKEPLGRRGHRRDFYQPWWEVLTQRHFDCEDGSMWVAARLRATGEDPSARVALIEFRGGGWHAVVLRRSRPQAADGDHVYPSADVPRMYDGARIYGGPDIGWDPAGWLVEDPSRRMGMRDCGRGRCYHPRVTKAQEDHGEPKVGRDPYVPFEVVAPAQAGEQHDDFTQVNAALSGRGTRGAPGTGAPFPGREGAEIALMDFFQGAAHNVITPDQEALAFWMSPPPTGRAAAMLMDGAPENDPRSTLDPLEAFR